MSSRASRGVAAMLRDSFNEEETVGKRVAISDGRTFRHNPALWLVCAPTLLLLLDFGGSVMLGTLALGLMATYILDALGAQEACFVCFWVTVGAQVLGHAVGAFLVLGLCVRAVGLAVVSSTFTLLLGVWGSLQLDWLPEQEPGLARLGERMLFALLPLPCAALPTWGAVAIYGASSTPWMLFVSLGVCYCLLCGNAPASFPSPVTTRAEDEKKAGAVEMATDATSSAVHAVAWVVLPALYYGALHRPTLHEPKLWPHHRLALCTMGAAATLVVAAMPAPWAATSGGGARVLQTLQVGAMLVLVLCAQQALALSPHGAVAIAAEPPYDQLFVCCALAAPVVLVMLRAWGSAALPRELLPPLSALVCALGSGCACAALALPRPYMLCALAAAFAGVRAASDGDVPSFGVCAAATAGMAYGLLRHVLGFVPYHSFGRGEAALDVTPLAASLLALLLLGALAVGCTLALRRGSGDRRSSGQLGEAPRTATWVGTLRGVALLLHAIVLARVEMALRADSRPLTGGLVGFGGGGDRNDDDDEQGGEETYPLPMLAISVACGLLLVERLQSPGAPPPPPTLWWLLTAVHCGRASLLLVDASSSADAYSFERDERSLVLSSALLALALLQPLHARLQRRAHGLRHGMAAATAAAAAAKKTGVGMAQLEGGGVVGDVSSDASPRAALLSLAARLALLVCGVLASRAQLLPHLLGLFEPRPSAPTTLGAMLLLLAAGGRPLASAVSTASTSAADDDAIAAALGALVGRLGVLVAVCGALLIALQPPLLLGELIDSALFTLFHPTASYSYGTTPRLLLWPPYLFIGVCLLLLSAQMGLLPVATMEPAVQLLFCAAAGAATALCACGALLPLERSLFLAAAAALGIAAAFVATVMKPHVLAPSGRRGGPVALFGAMAAMLPVALSLQLRAFGSAPVGAMLTALTLYRTAWLTAYAGICSLCALLLKLQANRQGGGSGGGGAAPRAQARRGQQGIGGPRAASTLQARAQYQQRRMQAARAGTSWMAPLGNLSCLGAVALSQAVHVSSFDGGARGAALLSPLLLLLHPHPPLSALHHGNRYAPCAMLAGAALCAAALLEVYARLELASLLPAVRGLALVGCAAPSVALCAKFLWDKRKGSELLIFMLAPLNLLPLLLAWPTPALRDFGAAGLVAAIVHIVLATHQKSEGLKVI